MTNTMLANFLYPPVSSEDDIGVVGVNSNWLSARRFLYHSGSPFVMPRLICGHAYSQTKGYVSISLATT